MGLQIKIKEVDRLTGDWFGAKVGDTYDVISVDTSMKNKVSMKIYRADHPKTGKAIVFYEDEVEVLDIAEQIIEHIKAN